MDVIPVGKGTIAKTHAMAISTEPIAVYHVESVGTIHSVTTHTEIARVDAPVGSTAPSATQNAMMVILVQTVVEHATKRAKAVIRPRVSVNTAVNQDGRVTFVKQFVMNFFMEKIAVCRAGIV